MSQPKVTTQGYTYLFEFEKEQVSIYFDRLHDDSKATKGEITVRSLIPNIPHHIHHSRFDLTSTTQKKALIKQLDERWKPEGWDWGDLIEQCIISVLEHFRRGEPLQTLEINDNQVIQHPDYLIWPLIPKDEPTIIYADGGSFKSHMAQVIAAILLTSWKNNDLGLVPLYDKPVPCLYLDWETNANTIKYTLLKLRKGLSLPAFNMHYRKCHQSFADDLAEIHRMVDQCKPELLIVDSIAAAVATDLNAADGAIRLLTRDIRQLNVTSLILAHRAKDEENRGPYGSVFFKNYSRSVWHLKKYQELGAARMQIALMCEKTNTSTMFKPMAFEIAFFDDGTTVERTDIFDVPELSANMPLIDRMVATLSHRTMDIKLLAEELQVKEAELSVLLSNRVDRFIRLNDGKWGVKTGRAVDNVY